MFGKTPLRDLPIKWSLISAVMLFVVLVSAQLVAHALTLLATIPTRDGLYGVFLTNGQVYFGSIAKEDDRRLTLQGIYYIQTKDGGTQPSATQTDVSLLKLGNELHGPEDAMEINRDHVLFIERLRDDGKVAKAIEAYRQK